MYKKYLTNEIALLKISVFLSTLLAGLGVVLALISDSLALLLDALYASVDVVITVLAIFAVKAINRPADSLYHFGYSKYEPLISGLEGISVLVLCGVIFFASIQDIINADKLTAYMWPCIYAACSTGISFFMSYWMKALGKELNSSILSAGGELWYFDGVISCGVGFGFILGFWMETSSYSQYTPYVDPIIAMLMAVMLVKRPIQIIWHNFIDLVDASPGREYEKKITDIVEQYRLAKYSTIYLDSLKIRRAGRRLFIHIKLNASDQTKSIAELKSCARELQRNLQVVYKNAYVDVVFV